MTLVELLQLFIDPTQTFERGYYTTAQLRSLPDRELSFVLGRSVACAKCEEERQEKLRKEREEEEARLRREQAQREAEEKERLRRELAQRQAEAAARAAVEFARLAEEARIREWQRQQAEEEERRRRAAEEAAIAKRRKQLKHGTWGLTYLNNQEYHNELVEASGKDITSVALTRSGGYSACYEGGSFCYASVGVPLHNRFNGRQKHLPGPEYVAFGAGGAYFIRFTDGSSWFDGCPTFLQYVNEAKAEYGAVQWVAFGQTEYDYFIVCTGGTQWRGLPTGLQPVLDERSSDVELLTLGPTGEWWCLFKDGGWRSHLPDHAVLLKEIHKVKSQQHQLRLVVLGDEGQFFMRFNKNDKY